MGRVAVALVLGLVVGIGVARIGNPTLSRGLALLEPIGAIWVNGIRMTVVPLVVALLLGAVARGTEARVGRFGGLAFGTFVALHVIVAVVALALVPALMSRLPIDPASVAQLQADATAASATTNEQVRSLPGFGQWVASLAPANVVRAAADGAMLPLIVFTLLFALALRRITPERRDNVLRVFDGVGGAMLEIVRWLIAAAPVGVFTLVAPTAARLGLSLAGALGYYALVYVAMMLAVAGVMCVVGAFGGRTPLPRFMRAALPAQAVAFSSSSSLASLPALNRFRRAARCSTVGGRVRVTACGRVVQGRHGRIVAHRHAVSRQPVRRTAGARGLFHDRGIGDRAELRDARRA